MSPSESVRELVDGAGLAREFEYAFTDGNGYEFEGSLAFALRLRKEIEHARPGFAHLFYDSAATATLTNRTPGRTVAYATIGDVFILLPHETGLGACWDSQTNLGLPFCIAGLRISASTGVETGGELPSGATASSASGLVRNQTSGSSYDEEAADAAVDAVAKGEVAGFEVTVRSSFRSGIRLVFDGDGSLVASCEIWEFDSFAELCAL